jgi:hypothetical protein
MFMSVLLSVSNKLAAEVSNKSSSRSERRKLAAQVSRTSKKQKVGAQLTSTRHCASAAKLAVEVNNKS